MKNNKVIFFAIIVFVVITFSGCVKKDNSETTIENIQKEVQNFEENDNISVEEIKKTKIDDFTEEQINDDYQESVEAEKFDSVNNNDTVFQIPQKKR